jgi:hypothetical protein
VSITPDDQMAGLVSGQPHAPGEPLAPRFVFAQPPEATGDCVSLTRGMAILPPGVPTEGPEAGLRPMLVTVGAQTAALWDLESGQLCRCLDGGLPHESYNVLLAAYNLCDDTGSRPRGGHVG